MQVPSAAPPGVRASDPRQTSLALPDLALLLQTVLGPDAHQQRLHDQRQAQQRRRDEQQQFATAVLTAPRPSELMAEAEQRMAPGSHAARRQQSESRLATARERDAGGFRRALHDAVRPETTEAAPKTGRPGDAASTTRTPPATATGTAGQTPTKNVMPNTSATTAEPTAAQGLLAQTGRHGQASVATFPTTLPATAPATAAARSAAATGIARVDAAGSAPAVTARGIDPVAAGAGLRSPQHSTATARASKAAEAEAPARNPDANTEQILRVIQARLGRERSIATLHLDPPDLGKIRLHMDLRNDQLTLRIDAETDAARRLLAEQLDTLRRGLEAAGIQLQRVELHVPDVAAGDGHADVPGHADQSAHGQEGTGPRDGQPEGSTDDGMDADSAPSGNGPQREDVSTGPAAESLVNIWA